MFHGIPDIIEKNSTPRLLADIWLLIYFYSVSVPIWALILICAGALLILVCCTYCICKRCCCKKRKKKEGKKGLKGIVGLEDVKILGHSMMKEKVGNSDLPSSQNYTWRVNSLKRKTKKSSQIQKANLS